MHNEPTSNRIIEFDGLRGVAIFLVLLFHYFVQHIETRLGSLSAYAQKYFSLAWVGVDVFFVLSGFLLGGILLDQRGAENYFKVFYLRRALRIVPAYVLFLGAFAFALVVFPPVSYPSLDWLLKDPFPFWSYALYVQNFLIAGEGRWGPNFGAMSWSLAVEEQFYLLFPWLIYWCPTRRLGCVLLALVLGAPVLRVILYFIMPHGAIAGFVLLPSRWDSLLLGALAAWSLRQSEGREWVTAHVRKLRVVFIGATLGISLFPFVEFRELSLGMAIVGHLWIAATVALLLVLLATGHLESVARCLRLPPLLFLGRISYSVYLFHQAICGSLFALVLGTGPHIRSWESLMLMFVALALTVLLATVTWYTFEAHLIRLGHSARYLQRSKIP
jgi:peptidoglycan/LPS O-acetylase OafA/YrhL